jgi:uncharacterized protein
MIPTIDMSVSPLDRVPPPTPSPTEPVLVQLRHQPKPHWVPSQFNARTVGEDGRLILWNTLSGAVCVFASKDRDRVLAHLSRKGLTGRLDKTGEFLKTRGYLVRDDGAEMEQFRYRYLKDQWRTDILELILMASEDCNFRCKYCYEKFKHGTMAPGVRQGLQAMALRRAPYIRQMTISWFGGEPLYGWEAVEELSPFFHDLAKHHDIAHRQSMTTNAYLLTEERATKLLEWGCNSFQITIDGLPEEHDCKRVGRDGSPTYDVILGNLRSLKARKSDFLVLLRVNYDRENLPRMGPFLEALSEDFAGDDRYKLRFRAVGKWGGPNDENLETCGQDEQRVALRHLRTMAQGLNLRQEGGVKEFVKFGNDVCYAARPYNFLVGATGKLMKCTLALDEMEENIVGQIHPDGRMELKDEHMSRWVNPHYESDTMCKSCHVLPVCQGVSCPLKRITDGKRSCCRVKGTLKDEMRHTLGEPLLKPRRAQPVAAAAS